MTIELLLVLFLQAEDNLDGTCALSDLSTVGDYDMRGVSELNICTLVLPNFPGSSGEQRTRRYER